MKYVEKVVFIFMKCIKDSISSVFLQYSTSKQSGLT